MAFLEFRIGSNNYELNDVTDCHSLNGVFFQSLTETSRVYNLVLNGTEKTDYVVAEIFGDVCNIECLNTSKMVFVSSINGFSTATDKIALEYAIQYLSNEEDNKLRANG